LRSLEEKYTTTWNILKKSEFSETFTIPEEVYANFIKEMQRGYDANNNAFHNFHHGIAGKIRFIALQLMLSKIWLFSYAKLLYALEMQKSSLNSEEC